MATSLIGEFIDQSGTTKRITWSNIDPDSPNSDLKAFINGVVTYSSAILKEPLVSARSAIVRTQTDTAVDLAS